MVAASPDSRAIDQPGQHGDDGRRAKPGQGGRAAGRSTIWPRPNGALGIDSFFIATGVARMASRIGADADKGALAEIGDHGIAHEHLQPDDDQQVDVAGEGDAHQIGRREGEDQQRRSARPARRSASPPRRQRSAAALDRKRPAHRVLSVVSADRSSLRSPCRRVRRRRSEQALRPPHQQMRDDAIGDRVAQPAIFLRQQGHDGRPRGSRAACRRATAPLSEPKPPMTQATKALMHRLEAEIRIDAAAPGDDEDGGDAGQQARRARRRWR